MSWLAPFFLTALPILALPIFLHLWKKRRRETLPWGAMQFLVSQTQQQRRISNIDRWLVLLARCLILLFVIGALARPLLHSEKYGTLQNQADDILVIDNSLSTSRVGSDATPAIDRIRHAALNWIESRPRGASIRILLTAGRPQWLTDDASTVDNGVTVLSSRIKKLRSVAARSDLVAALRFAATTELSDSEESITRKKRRVWLLTDGQATDWRFSSPEAMKSFCQELEAETHVQVSAGVVPVEIAGPNLAVSPLISDGWRRAPGEKVRMRARVTNLGSKASPATTAVWSLGREEISRETIGVLQPGESKQIEAMAYLQRAGSHVAACELRFDDQLVADNRSVAVVETLERIPVLLVCDKKPNPRSLDDADFFTAAMGRSVIDAKKRKNGNQNGRDNEKRWNTVFHPRRITSGELNKVSLDEYDAVVLLDPPPLASESMQKLGDYVGRGGGLWFLPGDQTNIDAFNRDWYTGGLGLSPVPLGSLSLVDVNEEGTGDENDEDIPESRVHTPQRTHPAVYWLSDSAQSDLDEVLIRRFYSVRRPNVDSDVRTLLRTGAGSPLAMLGTAGKGRVIIQTLPMQSSWTNWPLTGSFVVMVDGWLRHLTEPRQSILNLNPGAPLRLRVPVTQNASRKKNAKPEPATIKRPDGVTATVMATHAGSVREVRYSQTFESGIYRVQFLQKEAKPTSPVFMESSNEQEKPLEPPKQFVFSVSRPIEESFSNMISEDFTTTFNSVPNASIQTVTDDATDWLQGPSMNAEGEKTDETPRLPIWTPLLWALVAFLVLELMLASYASMRRFGRNVYRSDSNDELESITTQPAARSARDEVVV